MDTIPSQVLDSAVTGVGLRPGSLRDQLGDAETLLVFLRHFGCMFCRETISDLRQIHESDDEFPRILFFFQGTATEGRAFLRRYWPEARAVADPQLEFYERFGVRQATLLEALGPRVIAARRRASAKGHQNGPRSGDIWRLPGVFAVKGDRILWQFEPSHAADHPDFAQLPKLIREGARRRDGP